MNFIQWWHSVFDRSKEVTEPHYNLMKEAHEAGRLEGREECATMADELSDYCSGPFIANTIRERSNVKLRGAPLLARPSRTPC